MGYRNKTGWQPNKLLHPFIVAQQIWDSDETEE